MFFQRTELDGILADLNVDLRTITLKQRDQWFHKGNLRHHSYITAFNVSEDTLLNGSWFHDFYFLAGMKI